MPRKSSTELKRGDFAFGSPEKRTLEGSETSIFWRVPTYVCVSWPVEMLTKASPIDGVIPRASLMGRMISCFSHFADGADDFVLLEGPNVGVPVEMLTKASPTDGVIPRASLMGQKKTSTAVCMLDELISA